MFSTGGTIYQCLVGSIEFVLAHFLFDNFRTGQTDTAFFVHYDYVQSGSYEAHAAEAANLRANNTNDGENATAVLNSVHNFSVSQQACVCFVQTNTAGFEGNSYDRTTCIIFIGMSSFDVLSCFQSQTQGVNHLSAVNFADSAADEFAFHGNYKQGMFAQQANTGNGAVIKFYCSTQYRQMGAFKTIQRIQ